MNDATILIVEDEPEIAKVVVESLAAEGIRAEHAADGLTGLTQAIEGSHRLVILDIALPGIRGIEICRRLREHGKTVPILMLTSSAAEVDCVLALELGADEYVTKPFRVRELVARVKAILRRETLVQRSGEPGAPAPETVLVHGELKIDPRNRVVTLRGQEVSFTALEFQILYFLATHPDRVFTREELLEQVWGYQSDGYDAAVTTAMSRIRQKIEDQPGKPRYLLTIRSVGYKFLSPEPAGA